MTEEDSSNTAGPDELGIFINSDGEYRILVPKDWAEQNIQTPELAFLTIATVLRLAQKNEVEFRQSINRWAQESMKKGPTKSLKNPQIKH